MKADYHYPIATIILFAAMFITPMQLNAQSINWIGPFPGGFFISDVSDDGDLVVGNFGNVTLNVEIASRWTASGGIQELGTLPDRNNSNARAVSSDGNVVVGYSYDDTSYTRHYAAFRWTPSGGMQAIAPNALSSMAWDVSGDGSTVVGQMILSIDTYSRPFRWTTNGGLEDLSSIIGYGQAFGVSNDGSVVVGYADDTLSHIRRPFRLIGTTLEFYSSSNFPYSQAYSVSGDGKVVVGQLSSSNTTNPFRWDSVMQNLQSPEFQNSYASRTNYNGSIIVGYDAGPFSNDPTAWRWTSSNGFQNLNIIYSSLLPNNIHLRNAASISNDGRFIVGNAGDGVNQTGVAYILDTQSNLHITEPTIGSKFIAGETGLIKWTSGEAGQTLKIEYSVNDGNSYSQIGTIQANAGQYSWNVPINTLTTKARIRLTDLNNPSVTTESQKFKVKPYVLTRIDSNGDYYEFRKNRDQWGFWNNPNDMWPQTWWQQFNYQGTDPFTGIQYSQTQGNGAFAKSSPQDFINWESWVNAFGIDNCYYSTQLGYYKQDALLKWSSRPNKVWNGSCFGIAVASALAFGYKEEFVNKYPYFPDFVNPIAVTSDNQVKAVINELFIHQAGNPHLSYRNNIGLNKTPTTTLVELINMFKEDNSEVRTLSLVNNGPGSGGHAIIAYGLEQDTLLPDIYYVKVYDNSYPNSNNKITINTSANGGSGSWVDPDWPGWGGSQWLYLRDPVVTYLFNPTMAKINQKDSPFFLDANELQIYNPKSSSIKIIDQYGNVSGFFENTIKNDILNSAPIIFDNGSEGPPSGYSLQTDNYSVVISDFVEGISNTFFFTGNKSMMYERFGAFTGQRDSLHFDGGIFVNNPDPDYKEITLLSLFDEGTQEKLFTASGLQLLQDNSVKIENPDSNTIKIISYGVDNSYNVELNYSEENKFERFFYSGVSLYSNMTQIFVPEWTNLTVADLKVLVDFESDGIIDDSLLLQNQATDVEDQGSLLSPTKYNLVQNYPNPFNPVTNIRYAIPQQGNVSLKVYDILGNEVATLVDEFKSAGSYEVDFDATSLPSGVYFYRLQAGDFVQTRKMILLK